MFKFNPFINLLIRCLFTLYGRRTTRDCQTESRVNKTFWGFQKYKIQKSLQLNLRWGVSCTVLYCTVLYLLVLSVVPLMLGVEHLRHEHDDKSAVLCPQFSL